MSTTQHYKWITRRYPELQRKYPNRYVAVKDRKVVASGREFGEVYDAAIRKSEEGLRHRVHSLRGNPLSSTLAYNIPLTEFRRATVESVRRIFGVGLPCPWSVWVWSLYLKSLSVCILLECKR